MLHEFLTANRQELISRCKAKAGERFEPSLAPNAIDHGPPMFLQQLAGILRLEQQSDARPAPGSAGTGPDKPTEIGRVAALQGAELMRLGYTLDQVVHGYGDVCQAITGLAIERSTAISTDEFRTLNRCLDNAIADAVTAFGNAGTTSANAEAQSLPGRFAAFAAEERRLVDIAIHSFAVIKSGNVGINGATGNLLSHALEELHSLIDRTVPEIRAKGATTTAAAAAPEKGTS
jgi:hypothetical protein